MLNLQVLIVEDDISFAIELSMLVEEIGYVVQKVLDDSEEVLSLIQEEQPDIILMDIDIKGSLNGLEVITEIQNLKIPVLFITSHARQDYYEKARDMHAVGFLVKPVEKLTLRSSIELALRSLAGQKVPVGDANDEGFLLKDSFFIKKDSHLEKVPVKKILYIESARNYVILHTEGRKFMLRITMTTLSEKLPDSSFVRIHRSYFVNLSKIDALQLSDNNLKVGNEQLPIGRSYRKAFLEQLKLLK